MWDSITYDPVSDLVYFGTANAEPWNPAYRNTDGAGDSLYTASIVAVNPDTGEYVWHFQETPEDRWDFDSNQQITVADLDIGGTKRHVIMHAPKNGFFYVLDAKSGEFISGKPFVDGINWAKGLDPKTGKPDVNPDAKYELTGKPFLGFPGAVGAHSWSPMSYSPKTGLVYIPTNDTPQVYSHDPDWKPGTTGFQLGVDFTAGNIPADKAVRAQLSGDDRGTGRFRSGRRQGPMEGSAANPDQRRRRWPLPATWCSRAPRWANSGPMRRIPAKQLWSFPAQSGILAAPMTYSIDGEQYVAVLVGWGGVWDVSAGKLATSRSLPTSAGWWCSSWAPRANLPASSPAPNACLIRRRSRGTPAQFALGAKLYTNSCSVCHGNAAVAGALNPDLRHSVALGNPKLWQEIVHDGATQPKRDGRLEGAVQRQTRSRRSGSM